MTESSSHQALTSLRVLSWNIDMDTTPIAPRMHVLIRQIRSYNPDVVCLQEITERTYQIIYKALCEPPPPPPATTTSDSEHEQTDDAQNHTDDNAKQVYYDMHCSSEWLQEFPYFCAMLTRHGLFADDVSANSVLFPYSVMHRGYIHINAALHTGQKVSFITSHLESLATGAPVRKQQLADILDIQRDMVEQGAYTIFAADTNLRESEVPARDIEKNVKKSSSQATIRRQKKSRMQAKFLDAWVLSGSDDFHKFTWDTSLNDNLSGFDDFKPKARYDRSFLLAPPHVTLSIPQFELIGRRRLPCGKFISDHWGVLFTARFEPTSSK